MFRFSYNLSRPYPFKWFTPLVIIGSAILTALFSTVNLISTGYSLVSEYSSQPNLTMSQELWFSQWPKFLSSKLQPYCQPAELEVNSNFFTTNAALTYSLTMVVFSTNDSAHSSSLTYQNNFFQDCSINWIQIDVDASNPTALVLARARYNPDLTASITCQLIGPTGPMHVNLFTEYSLVGKSQFTSFTSNTNGSLYWAQSLLSMFWVQLEQVMEDSAGKDGNPTVKKGSIVFTPNGTFTDIEDRNYFNLHWWFLLLNDSIFYGSHTTSEGNFPHVWPVSDRLAKSFQSTILSDLGQISTPNLLTNVTLLQNFTSDFEAINYNATSNNNVHIFPGPATKDYDSLKDTTGPLQTLPSVISTKYLCQVPKRKSTGTLLVVVLIQDLVFLSASWRIFTFLIGFFLLRNRPNANCCEGCMEKQAVNELELTDRAISKQRHARKTIFSTGESQQSLIDGLGVEDH